MTVPVSYTHLDVYKRQKRYHADHGCSPRNPAASIYDPLLSGDPAADSDEYRGSGHLPRRLEDEIIFQGYRTHDDGRNRLRRNLKLGYHDQRAVHGHHPVYRQDKNTDGSRLQGGGTRQLPVSYTHLSRG